MLSELTSFFGHVGETGATSLLTILLLISTATLGKHASQVYQCHMNEIALLVIIDHEIDCEELLTYSVLV